MEVMQNEMVVAILGNFQLNLVKWNYANTDNLYNCYIQIGKGDLVGCDMNTHLQAYNGTGQGQTNNPDVVVKSSSDVKVSETRWTD